jgi:hypothetical protein
MILRRTQERTEDNRPWGQQRIPQIRVNPTLLVSKGHLIWDLSTRFLAA